MAFYISNLLFAGKNTYGVYTDLKYKKQQLELNIRKIQLENANLQKQYLELKNLEPEEL
ncbi:MAG: septum formation initiator [Campylobacterota bacterium]|nr:septum formation initiator [Campylobacterota bacterium]